MLLNSSLFTHRPVCVQVSDLDRAVQGSPKHQALLSIVMHHAWCPTLPDGVAVCLSSAYRIDRVDLTAERQGNTAATGVLRRHLRPICCVSHSSLLRRGAITRCKVTLPTFVNDNEEESCVMPRTGSAGACDGLLP